MRKFLEFIFCCINIIRFFPQDIEKSQLTTIEETICNDINKAITKIEKKANEESA